MGLDHAKLGWINPGPRVEIFQQSCLRLTTWRGYAVGLAVLVDLRA